MAGPAPRVPLRPDSIPGYQLDRKLGSGSGGVVFLARQLSLDRQVAVKFLTPTLAQDPAYVERFFNEARTAARVIHENIVAVVEAGKVQGHCYFVMEYVAGETLQPVLRREAPLPEERALRIARQVVRGLQKALVHGLIHRDIKPANIMIGADGTAKILDFGLARRMGMPDEAAPADIVESTPAYASPEQARGRQDLDFRTDMYSLGVVLFEMLTGRRPFDADSSRALLQQHINATPPAPQNLNPAISAKANRLVLRLLRKNPQERFAGYDELLEAIDSSLEEGAVPAGSASPHAHLILPLAKLGVLVVALLVIAWMVSKLALGPAPQETPPPPSPPSTVAVESTPAREAPPAPLPEPESPSLLVERLATPPPAPLPKEVPPSRIDEMLAAPLEPLPVPAAEPPPPAPPPAPPPSEPEPQKEAPAPPPEPEKAPPSAPLATPDIIEALRHADHRADGARRAAALAGFAALASQSPVYRAAELLLSRNDADWKLLIDTLHVKTEQMEITLQGQAAPSTDQSITFMAADGRRVVKRPDGRVSIGGGTFVASLECTLTEDQPTPTLQALEEYLAALPLDKAPAMTPSEHAAQLRFLADKINALRGAAVEPLQLFVCAHVEALIAAGSPLDAAVLKQARFQASRSTPPLWGPAATVDRIALARALAAKSKIAVETTDREFRTRLLVALAKFLEDQVNPADASSDWKKLAQTAPPGPERDFCEDVAKQLKDASACGDCRKEGKVSCSKCSGKGIIPCVTCDGSGNIRGIRVNGGGREFGNFFLSPCKDCKQKGKVTCPDCNGRRILVCTTCNGKKTFREVYTDGFRGRLDEAPCTACSGTGSLFPQTAYPCFRCDGAGRFPHP